jgi:hypothetical protein
MADIDQRSSDFVIPDEIVVELKKPLTKKAGGEVLTRLTFHPPTVGEMKQIEARSKSQGDSGAGILMLSLLCNDKLAVPDVEALNFLDMQICVEKLSPFVGLKPQSEEPSN